MLVKPVEYSTPDGAERKLRFSQGAKRRISERFGRKSFDAIMQEYGDNAIIECAYFMMYDANGAAPADLTLAQFEESFAPQGMTSLIAACMSAVTQGETSKNELEALLTTVQQMNTEKIQTEILKTIGSGSGVSADSASASVSPSSGGSRPKNSKRSLIAIAKSKTA